MAKVPTQLARLSTIDHAIAVTEDLLLKVKQGKTHLVRVGGSPGFGKGDWVRDTEARLAVLKTVRIKAQGCAR